MWSFIYVWFSEIQISNKELLVLSLYNLHIGSISYMVVCVGLKKLCEYDSVGNEQCIVIPAQSKRRFEIVCSLTAILQYCPDGISLRD